MGVGLLDERRQRATTLLQRPTQQVQPGLGGIATVAQAVHHALLDAVAAIRQGIEGRHEIDEVIGEEVAARLFGGGALATSQLRLAGATLPAAGVGPVAGPR